MEQTQYYYTVNQRDPVGPMSLDELRSLIEQGRVRSDHMVWWTGRADWTQAGQVAELTPTWAQANRPAPPQPAFAQPAAQPVGAAQPLTPVYETEFAPPSDTPPAYVDPRYAGFWLRLAAFIIDFIIMLITQICVFFPLMVVWSIIDQRGFNDFMNNPWSGHILNLCSMPIAWLYYALSESSRLQGTLGKVIIGLRVTDLNG